MEIQDLGDLAPFEVTLQGQVIEAHLSQRPCLWFEWGYSTNEPGQPPGAVAWEQWSVGFHTEGTLQALTPRGSLRLPWRSMRPHLAPAWSRVLGIVDAATAPLPVQPLLAALEPGEGPLVVEEYLLEADRPYWALARGETYALPPDEPEGEPVDQVSWVLWLSDLPFADGRPARPLSPLFRGFTF